MSAAESRPSDREQANSQEKESSLPESGKKSERAAEKAVSAPEASDNAKVASPPSGKIPAKAGNPETSDRKARVLFFYSLQGTLTPVLDGKKSLGGIEYLGALIAQRRTERTLLCTNGDFLPGDVNDRRPVVEALGILGVRVASIGNLELNYGVKGLKKKLDKAPFAVVNGNIRQESGPWFAEHVVERMDGVNVLLTGVISQQAALKANSSVMEDLRFTPPFEAVERLLAEATRGALVVVLSDLSAEQDVELARKYPRIDLIIGRYDLNPENGFRRVGSVSIVRLSKNRGVELGEVDLAEKGGEWESEGFRVFQAGPESSHCRGLSLFAPATKLVEEWQRKERHLQEILGESKVALDGGNPNIRQQETNFGNLLADILLETSPDAEIGLLNSGFVRGSLAEGPISRGNLRAALPFENKVVELEVSGETLKDALENSVANHENISGAFLQVAGLSFSFDPKRPRFSRILDIQVQGEHWEAVRKYRLVTLSYIASGGDDYAMFRSIEQKLVSQQNFHEIVEDYIHRRGEVTASVEGRIRMNPSEQ